MSNTTHGESVQPLQSVKPVYISAMLMVTSSLENLRNVCAPNGDDNNDVDINDDDSNDGYYSYLRSCGIIGA
jgi:hypothetical protein